MGHQLAAVSEDIIFVCLILFIKLETKDRDICAKRSQIEVYKAAVSVKYLRPKHLCKISKSQTSVKCLSPIHLGRSPKDAFHGEVASSAVNQALA